MVFSEISVRIGLLSSITELMKKVIYQLLILAGLSSCGGSDKDDSLPTSGVITGSVLLFEEGSTPASPAGMRISIENPLRQPSLH